MGGNSGELSAAAQANGLLTLDDLDFRQAGLLQQFDELLDLSDIHSIRSCRRAGIVLY
jgi:hypothetical protein